MCYFSHTETDTIISMAECDFQTENRIIVSVQTLYYHYDCRLQKQQKNFNLNFGGHRTKYPGIFVTGVEKGKLGAYAMLFDSAERPDDRTDYCLD